jgi:hypothetical protein
MGSPVCIKAIRTWDLARLGEIKNVCGYVIDQRRTKRASYQTLRRDINGRTSISHPNVLPIIEVSEALFPFCIMSPWMPDGNIGEYTQTNPGAHRPMLVCPHQLEDRRGQPLTK